MWSEKIGLMKKKLYSTVRFVQSVDEDYNRIEAVFCGLRDGYCEGNSQPVIDYLSNWDDEQELTSIAHGQLEFVIDEIPETDEVQDVTIP